MTIEAWEHFFKPEVRSSGQVYFKKGQVRSSQPSDTEIQAFIRGSTPCKVSFKSPSVESPLVKVDCSCPASQKGQFCKHIWATLLKVEQSHPDFLDSKSEIEKMGSDSEDVDEEPSESKASFKPQKKSALQRPLSEKQIEIRESLKAKQAAYRKEQYQKQKQRIKSLKAGEKVSKLAPPVREYPEDVKKALKFFTENGFEMEDTLNPEILRLAKKHLARVFHPDKGGSHQEILDLNKNSEILMGYLESQK